LDQPDELLQKPCLTGQDFLSCFLQSEPARAVDLGEFAALEHKRVAPDRCGVAVEWHRPRVDDLAAFLLERRERSELARGGEAGLFSEFTLRRGQRILAGLELALRDRPGAGVFLRPKRSARVDEKNLQDVLATIKQQPRAISRQEPLAPWPRPSH